MLIRRKACKSSNFYIALLRLEDKTSAQHLAGYESNRDWLSVRRQGEKDQSPKRCKVIHFRNYAPEQLA